MMASYLGPEKVGWPESDSMKMEIFFLYWQGIFENIYFPLSAGRQASDVGRHREQEQAGRH